MSTPSLPRRSRPAPALGGIALALALVAAALPFAAAAAGSDAGVATAAGPRVADSVRHDTSPPLAELVTGSRPAAPTGLVKEVTNPTRERQVPRAAHAPGVGDPLLARQEQAPLPLSPTPSPLLTFDGSSADDNAAVVGFRVIPPDPAGDIGPDHYVQWNNLIIEVFDRSGTSLAGPVAGNKIWEKFGGVCQDANAGDPQVLYDHLADRWVLSQFSGYSGTLCVAVSATGDPTGSYHRYAFQVSGDSDLPDYPKLGLWGDAYMYAADNFGISFENALAIAFERDAMLAGAPAQMVGFDFPCTGGDCPNGVLPADLEGDAPPAGTPALFAGFWDSAFDGIDHADGVRLWEMAVDWTAPGDSTFTDLGIVGGAPVDRSVCGFSSDCIPQCDTTQKLDTLAIKMAMWRAHYRHGASHDTLLINTTVDAGGDRAGIRWAELRDDGGGWEVHQEGTFAPDDGVHRWMGSIAMDGSGNICLGYSASSESLCPSVRYVCRSPGDPLGTLPGGEVEMRAGGGAQLSYTRWGDYSSLVVDAADDCTFWYTQELYEASGDFDWSTVVGSFRMESCPNAAPQVTVTSPPGGASFTEGETIDFAGSAVDDLDGDLSASLAWTSSLDGVIGTGAAFSTSLSVGVHTVVAEVADSFGLEGSAEIEVGVASAGCPLDLALSDRPPIVAREVHGAVTSITAGPGIVVEAGGELVVRAGSTVVLGDGVEVASGGTLEIDLSGDPCR